MSRRGARVSPAWVRRRLLTWYDTNARRFVWRRRRASPWLVLVSEFLLRKTGARKVDPIVRELIRLAPSPEALLRVPPRRIGSLIHPLGLQNMRARALRQIAGTLVAEHGGRVPRDAEALAALPHVGRYMVNSVLTVGFGEPRPIVDANVMRLLHRVHGVREVVEIHRADNLWDLAGRHLPKGDAESAKRLNWALVDFGALVCTARAPRCLICPLRERCPAARGRRTVSGRRSSVPTQLPLSMRKNDPKHRSGGGR